jgi:hypothetical protein
MSTRCQIGLYESKDAKLDDWKPSSMSIANGNREVILLSIVPFWAMIFNNLYPRPKFE